MFIIIMQEGKMRILHTSDLHIGKRVNEFSMIDDQRYILKQIKNIAFEKSVDVLVIAGDVYDRSIPPIEGVELLDEFLEEVLSELNIPIVMISGNHDSGSRLSFGNKIMNSRGLYIEGEYGENVEKISIDNSNFYMFPYVDPAVVRRNEKNDSIKTHNDAMKFLVESIEPYLDKNKVNIAIYHGYVTAGEPLEESDSERRTAIGGADEVRAEIFEKFDYVALGHLHGPQKVGKESVRYSGSPLKYSFSEEKQKKSITIVDFDMDKKLTIEKVPIDAKRDLITVEGTLEELLKGNAVEDRNSYLRVQLSDKEVLDPMNKLRKVYPYVMVLEKKEIIQSANLEKKDVKSIKKMSVIDIFGEFYRETYGEDMTSEELEIIERINRSSEGVEA
jgi:exonuclease SbcD